MKSMSTVPFEFKLVDGFGSSVLPSAMTRSSKFCPKMKLLAAAGTVVAVTGFTVGVLLFSFVWTRGTNFGVSPFVCDTLFVRDLSSFVSVVDSFINGFRRLGFNEKLLRLVLLLLLVEPNCDGRSIELLDVLVGEAVINLDDAKIGRANIGEHICDGLMSFMPLLVFSVSSLALLSKIV